MQAWVIKRNIGGYYCCFGVGGSRQFAFTPYLSQGFIFERKEYAENEIRYRGLVNTCMVVSVIIIEDNLNAREQQLLKDYRNKINRFINFLSREDAKNNNAKQLAIGERMGAGFIDYRALWKEMFNEDLQQVERGVQ